MHGLRDKVSEKTLRPLRQGESGRYFAQYKPEFRGRGYRGERQGRHAKISQAGGDCPAKRMGDDMIWPQRLFRQKRGDSVCRIHDVGLNTLRCAMGGQVDGDDVISSLGQGR